MHFYFAVYITYTLSFYERLTINTIDFNTASTSSLDSVSDSPVFSSVTYLVSIVTLQLSTERIQI